MQKVGSIQFSLRIPPVFNALFAGGVGKVDPLSEAGDNIKVRPVPTRGPKGDPD